MARHLYFQLIFLECSMVWRHEFEQKWRQRWRWQRWRIWWRFRGRENFANVHRLRAETAGGSLGAVHERVCLPHRSSDGLETRRESPQPILIMYININTKGVNYPHRFFRGGHLILNWNSGNNIWKIFQFSSTTSVFRIDDSLHLMLYINWTLTQNKLFSPKYPSMIPLTLPAGPRHIHNYENLNRLGDISNDISGSKWFSFDVYVDLKTLEFPGLNNKIRLESSIVLISAFGIFNRI